MNPNRIDNDLRFGLGQTPPIADRQKNTKSQKINPNQTWGSWIRHRPVRSNYTEAHAFSLTLDSVKQRKSNCTKWTSGLLLILIHWVCLFVVSVSCRGEAHGVLFLSCLLSRLYRCLCVNKELVLLLFHFLIFYSINISTSFYHED